MAGARLRNQPGALRATQRAAARWGIATALAALLVTLTATAHADAPSRTRFGFVPGFRFGFGFGTAPHRGFGGELSDEFASGFALEPHADLVVLFAGDRIGLTLSTGFVWQWLNGADSIAYPGIVAHPTLDVGVSRNLFFRFGVGPIVGWMSQPGSDAAFTPGLRGSVELNVVGISTSVFELGLGLGVFHTRSLEAEIGPVNDRIITQFASTTAMMNAVVSFAPYR